MLRRAVASGRVSAHDATEALDLVRDLSLLRHGHDALLPRIWALRGSLTPYDAAYVALAEALDAPLVTFDSRVAAAPGNAARVDLLTR